MTLIIKKKPAQPADPLIPDAQKAENVETPEQQSARFWHEFPPPDAKPKPCGFCDDKYIRGCREDEHARCFNFKAAKRREYRLKEASHGTPVD